MRPSTWWHLEQPGPFGWKNTRSPADTSAGPSSRASQTDNGYQDMKFDSGQIIASGILPDKTGAIDWLDYPSLHLARRVKAGNTDRGVLYTREAMAIRGNKLLLLPEDGASRLFVFDLGVK